MPITAISTQQTSTNLTITTTEILNLEKMGSVCLIPLARGLNNVAVGPGVYKISSTNPISVVADNNSVILTNRNKDDPQPDPSILGIGDDQRATLQAFLASKAQSVE